MDEDLSEDSHVDSSAEEAALRAALNRLGSQRAPSPPRTGNTPRPVNDAPARLSLRPTMDQNQQRKRRFVRDGDVQVERQALTRPTGRTAHFSETESVDLDRHKRLLDDERRLREQAERQLSELETSHRTMKTRLGHAEMLLNELKQSLATRNMELADRTAELSAERSGRQAALAEIKDLRAQIAAAPKKRERVARQQELTLADEPEPVKWWKD
ncbi:hypothetical protein J2D73_02555 [Acetobacter sacchari]|uniref:Uncharacterized protein n=1 Tax=Acetobacter sacchari TaxID=2661687 RepID=A0ABS3LS00_9PROT|nr:hypothetical protein [Acetobacter sacchari]MBO1358679.1 hypothetical protein [Acetobacter sacchari]